MKKNCLFLLMILGFFTSTQQAFAEIPNTTYSWGFKRGNAETQAEAGSLYDQIVARQHAIYKGNPNEKTIYLTFDNGYENGYTTQILDILKKQHVPATFFVTGHYLESASDFVKRMVKEGHIIGNHSWHHLDFTKATDDKIKSEMETVRAKTEELTGQKEMKYTRPPRGVFSERTIAITYQLGYRTIFWSVAYFDWDVNQQKGKQHAYDSIMKQIHPGAIILLHSVSKDNAEALDLVITDLKAKGYQFKSLDKLP